MNHGFVFSKNCCKLQHIGIISCLVIRLINGDINLPVLGYVKVEGLTISQITKKIEELLVNEGILLNPSIDVKIVNAYFTILGEVNKPGRYSFIKDMDILQAIGIAGDLTINGVRDNIKIMRRNDSNYEISNVDLTKSNFINSDYFQIMPGDILLLIQIVRGLKMQA